MKIMARVFAFIAIAAVGACAVRLGGPTPLTYDTLALTAEPAADANTVADRIAGTGASLVLVSAQQDSAWFGDVADGADLLLSGPGKTGPSGLAFMTRGLELLGDSSLVLEAEDGSRIHMHDALYQLDETRLLDLMAIRADPVVDLSSVVRTLLAYEATDVMATATLILAVEAAQPAMADSIAVRLRAAFENAADCATDGPLVTAGLRLLYRPPVRVRCEQASLVDAPRQPILARLVFARY